MILGAILLISVYFFYAMETVVKLFEEKKVRTHWDEVAEEWYFSVIDVVEILTGSTNPRDYWFKMKQRVTLDA